MKILTSHEAPSFFPGDPMITVFFDPHDCWVGLFWKIRVDAGYRTLELYFCLLPCLPINITFYSKIKEAWW